MKTSRTTADAVGPGRRGRWRMVPRILVVLVVVGALIPLSSGVASAGYHAGYPEDFAPGSISDLRAEAGDEQVTLRWGRPSYGINGWGTYYIEGYEVQWKVGNGSYNSWTRISGSSRYTRKHTVTGLTNGTAYTFRVRPWNAWSHYYPASAGADPSNAVSATPAGNSAPTFNDGATADRSVGINTSAGAAVGSPVAATDANGDTLTYSMGWGTEDVEFFNIDSATGQLRTESILYSPDRPDPLPGRSVFEFEVHVSDGKSGGTDTITVTVTVTGSGTGNTGTANAEAAPPTLVEPPPAERLRASWSPPGSHDGTEFTFRLTFSKPVSLSFRNVRDVIVSADGGVVTKARRVTRGSNQGWDIRVQPSGSGDITLKLLGGVACGNPAAVCTRDGEQLSQSLAAIVAGS